MSFGRNEPSRVNRDISHSPAVTCAAPNLAAVGPLAGFRWWHGFASGVPLELALDVGALELSD
jgi:hypothetical protein